MPKYTIKNEFGLSKKEETFCITYLSTGSRYKAVEAAYDFKESRDKSNMATKLLRDVRIQKYMAFLHSQVVQNAVIDKAKILTESVRLYEQLLDENKTGEAVKMIDIIAKLSGAYETTNVTVDHIIKTNWAELPNNNLNNNLLDDGDDNIEKTDM